MPSMQATASRASKKLKIKKVKNADVENMGKTRDFPHLKEKHMTQREHRTYKGKNGKEYRIETINTNPDDIKDVVTKEYSRHRNTIKEYADTFLPIWNNLNTESAFASFEDFENTIMELNGYSLTGEQGMLYMFNFLQTADVLLSMEFIDKEIWGTMAGHSILPFFVIASEIRRSKSYLDDVMILTEKIKELEK